MIPLVAPTITEHDRRYICGRIADGGFRPYNEPGDGSLLTDEAEVQRFEEAFAERVDCAGAVAVCSGTVALKLAIRTLEVAIPSWTCVAVRNAAARGRIHYQDTYYDVPTATMTFDPTRAAPTIIVPHPFGTRATGSWAAHRSRVIEDYTLSLGAIPQLTGRLGVCSTHASKMISTGRGGVIFSDDISLLDQIRLLAHYENHLSVAHSYGMSALQAALGVSQLEQLDEFIERRREIAATYTDLFSRVGIDGPDPDCGSTFFRYLIVVADPVDAMERLWQHGIEAGRGVWPPLHQLAGLPDDKFPGTMASVNRLLSVPCHPSLGDGTVTYIADQVIRICAP